MTVYMCMKAAMTQPSLLDSSFSFHVATAIYLVAMAKGLPVSNSGEEDAGKLTNSVPMVLKCLPEFLAENLQDFLLFVHRFKDMLFEVILKNIESFLCESVLTGFKACVSVNCFVVSISVYYTYLHINQQKC